MKRVLLVLGIIFGLFSAVLLLSHYYPNKVPKAIANSISPENYRKIPRQVREYFPWLKPKKAEKAQYVDLQELNKKIEDTLAEEAVNKKQAPQSTEEILQQVLDNFYQKLVEGNFNESFELMHSVSQESFTGDNFVNYYTLIKDTFIVKKITVDKKLVKIPQYKDPITNKIIKNVIKAKVTFQVTDTFSVTKSVDETVTNDLYFAQEGSTWKIVEVELNNKNIKEKRYYYFIDEGYKRLKYKDTFGAIEFFRKAVKENKLSINANYGLSAALYQIAYYDKAIETVQKMESIYKKKYVTKLAIDSIDLKAIKKLDQERLSNGYYIMACALIKKGNKPAAKDTLYKALALNSNNKYALTVLKTIPSTIAAKPAPIMYKEEVEKEDPFKSFRENPNKEAKQPDIMAIDPEQAVNMLNNR